MKSVLISICTLFFCTCVNAQTADTASSAMSKEVEIQQYQHCLAELDQFFTNGLSPQALSRYLNAQFKVTTHRLLASMIALREEQQKAYRDGKRSIKAISTYSLQLKEHITAIEDEAGDDPQFLEARQSFAEAPLSILTLARLAPFIERSILKRSKIYDKGAYTANFRLDSSDFIMLNFLAYVEDHRRKPLPRTTFVNHIENYAEEKLVEMEQWVNVVIVDRHSIQVGQRFIESFWRELVLPKVCNKVDAVTSAIERRDAFAQKLFDSMLKREDMKAGREEISHVYVFHTGRTSPNRWAEDADVYNESDDEVDVDMNDEANVF